MCVIFLSYRQHPKYPLIFLANRDEFYDRPTAKADYWEDYPDIFAGRDLVGKGTWLGVTKSGRFSAVTNYRDPDQEKGHISRGSLVVDFLKSDISASEYLNIVKSHSSDFDGFNLLVGEISPSRDEIFYYSNRMDEVIELNKGLYGLSNHLLDTPWRKVEKGKQALTALLGDERVRKEAFFELLGDTTLAEDEELPDTGIGYEKEKLLSAIFIKTPVYGTRCSTVILFDEQLQPDFEERIFV